MLGKGAFIMPIRLAILTRMPPLSNRIETSNKFLADMEEPPRPTPPRANHPLLLTLSPKEAAPSLPYRRLSEFIGANRN